MKKFNEEFWPFKKKEEPINTDPVPGIYNITTDRDEVSIPYSTLEELKKLKNEYPLGGNYLNDSLYKKYCKIRLDHMKNSKSIHSWNAPFPNGPKITNIKIDPINFDPSMYRKIERSI